MNSVFVHFKDSTDTVTVFERLHFVRRRQVSHARLRKLATPTLSAASCALATSVVVWTWAALPALLALSGVADTSVGARQRAMSAKSIACPFAPRLDVIIILIPVVLCI